jgi:transcriptional regulator with XRE-family HTH domain
MAKQPRGARKSPLDHEPESVLYARKKSGLSQADSAEAIGISPSHLSEIEKGTRNAPPHLLQKMATVYNCPVVVLERKRSVPA